MAELLIEVGCEELPASFVMRAAEDLCEALHTRLETLLTDKSSSSVLATPRRLIVHITDLLDRQLDVTKDVRGPAAKAAYDAEGKPSKALEGFCRGQGVDPATARVEGEYVFVTVAIPGRPATDVLATLIPEAIKSLTFDKTMRWAHHRMRFARPIRWIVALLDDKVIAFELEGVVSANQSKGHRFNAPAPFTVTSFDQLITELRSREVEPDPEARRTRIRQTAVAKSARVDMSDALVDENAFLCEWPTCVHGTFDASFLELPEPVLVTVMAKHERFFPVRGADGKVTNEFVSVRNGGVDEIVAAGNAWVLNARLNDAKFFYDEDKKHTLDEFLEKTEGIVFQAELGTVRERADRLARLAAVISKATGAGAHETDLAQQACKYAKADLSTGLVSELAELQGVIGAEYARREGLSDEVCWAIATQYAAEQNPTPDSVQAKTALRLVLADQLDKLAGYLGLGLVPSGSSDPFGLRRAAGMVMEIALSWEGGEIGEERSLWPHYIDLKDILWDSVRGYRDKPQRKSDEDVVAAFGALLRQRYETLMPGVKPDWLDAVIGAKEDLEFQPGAVQTRLLTLAELAEDIAFVQTATRPLNITAAADKKGIKIGAADDANLDSLEGLALRKALHAVTEADEHGLKSLQAPIDAFFDSTMIMVDDERVRNARLALLRDVSDKLREVADFSKIVIEG